ncbi:succinate dehydrogenase/fumarate reductase flavoprotein subunit [Desulfobacter hydrogenophilus]|uniref:FAD-binding protein n=1 Tax=Desulfobacter hydrogenophilus TaxID=2291 RepID=A0A328F788_9BACT|nr:FAD-binding protein [Desulfobacter hydrogenophilus]NDY74161.1 FAD-binding protein [Desulfobacter hydrogenophilus]QBH12586.1 FAD-binding protein [Desulfobacter hydrogenophilus]RAM00229.1 succinate dehydrogenase/fumarate reductase flavoprotein subunit [Desulfobacter hydrogenophilus]
MTSSQAPKEISRRKFMTVAGGAAGLAAMAAMGLSPDRGEYSPNISKVDVSKITYNENQADVLIIGGGMAGVFAAVKAHDAGSRVLMVSKGRLGSSGMTPFAKGIFAYDPATAKMSLDQFVETVSRSALGTNNPVYTRQMAEHSLARVNELKEWGFFKSPLYNKSFNNPIKERNIPVKERIVITHLIKEKDRIAGAAGFSLDEEKVHFFKAKSVILCTGAGGFKPNGFPICDLTHDGSVMAYNIGAKVTGKEWNDGHPGKAKNAAACFDGWGDMFEQKPGINGVEVRHDLGVDLNYKAYMSGNPIKMGGPGQKEGKAVKGGPYVPEEFKQNGPHQGEQGPGPGGTHKEGGAPPGMAGTLVGGSSAGMAIHKSEGLVPINEKCESNIPGLYAAGDALGSHMAGAIYTQIGSSLAGSAVQGAVAGKSASEYCQGVEMPIISKAKMNDVQEEILAPLKREAGYSPSWVTQTLQGIMIPNFIIYIKKENLLKAALAYVEELRDHHMPMLRAADLHELRLAFETANMIISAEMKLKASLMRKESRCSHFRLDYPEMDTQNWNAWINIYKNSDGSMKLEKQSFDSWPTAKS